MKALIHALELAARAGVGGMFAYAGASKLGAPDVFADAIHAYHVLPAALIDPVALTLPFFEVLVGAGLLFGWRLRENALAAALMTAVFFVALLQAQLRGFDLDCGCLGPSAWAPLRAVPPLLRDGVLLGCSLFLRFRCRPAGFR